MIALNQDAVAQDSALRQLIAERAYQIWEDHGRPQGCDKLHWRQAEEDILGHRVVAFDDSGATCA